MGLEALLTTQIIGLQPLLDAKLEGSTGSTDNRVLRSDGTGGSTIQNSAVTIDDSGNVTGVVALTTTGKVAVPAGDYFNAGLEIGTTGLYGSSALTTRVGGQECSYLTQSVLNLRSSIIIGWTGTSSATGVVDVRMARNGSGQLDIRGDSGLRVRNFANSASAALACGAITASGVVNVGTYTFGTLPAAASNAGALAQITDSSVTTNGTIAAGGGSDRAIVFSNGTDWIVAVA